MSVVLGPSRPPTFPPLWASGWGEDRIGLWAELTVNGVTSRYRWIKPGHFTMGSPASEPGRYDGEDQREVAIQEGFWLGDTACTQALWQAVMGENPSHFKGENRPVEMVSWHDCQAFCGRLNELVPGMAARLPHEAEWEYACRAGTTTAFSFGDSITADQVNYNAEVPLEGSPKGLYKGETLPVKERPPNHWGLYQLHGNVWEWCSDPYERMKDGSLERKVDIKRVLRGGTWFLGDWLVRSAARVSGIPNERDFFGGFRLVPGPAQKNGRGPTAVGERRRSGQDPDPSGEKA